MNNKAWELSKELAHLIELQEPYTLKGEERHTYDVMVAQDFYNLFNLYNQRYLANQTLNKKMTKLLEEMEALLMEMEK